MDNEKVKTLRLWNVIAKCQLVFLSSYFALIMWKPWGFKVWLPKANFSFCIFLIKWKPWGYKVWLPTCLLQTSSPTLPPPSELAFNQIQYTVYHMPSTYIPLSALHTLCRTVQVYSFVNVALTVLCDMQWLLFPIP